MCGCITNQPMFTVCFYIMYINQLNWILCHSCEVLKHCVDFKEMQHFPLPWQNCDWLKVIGQILNEYNSVCLYWHPCRACDFCEFVPHTAPTAGSLLLCMDFTKQHCAALSMQQRSEPVLHRCLVCSCSRLRKNHFSQLKDKTELIRNHNLFKQIKLNYCLDFTWLLVCLFFTIRAINVTN